MKRAFSRPPNNDFGRVLADVRREDGHAEDEAIELNFVNPVAAGTFLMTSEEELARAGASYWNDALAWIAEQDEFAAGEAHNDRPLDDSPETIAAELRLHEVRTPEGLNTIRRHFMWRNHPDRQNEAQRSTATRRVAIANMLIDRAQAELALERQLTK